MKKIAVRLQNYSSVVSSNNMSEAVREGFGKSCKGNIAPLKIKIDTFIEVFFKIKSKAMCFCWIIFQG